MEITYIQTYMNVWRVLLALSLAVGAGEGLQAYAQVTKNTELYTDATSRKAKGFDASKLNALCQPTTLPSSMLAYIKLEQGGKRVESNISDSSAQFATVADPQATYDCSYKVYTAQSGAVRIEYKTYASAQSLSIQVRDDRYTLSSIVGSCDTSLNDLRVSYVQIDGAEVMTLAVDKDIPLAPHGKGDKADYSADPMWLKRGSYFVFVSKLQ